jgi:hypothetical protein
MLSRQLNAQNKADVADEEDDEDVDEHGERIERDRVRVEVEIGDDVRAVVHANGVIGTAGDRCVEIAEAELVDDEVFVAESEPESGTDLG